MKKVRRALANVLLEVSAFLYGRENVAKEEEAFKKKLYSKGFLDGNENAFSSNPWPKIEEAKEAIQR